MAEQVIDVPESVPEAEQVDELGAPEIGRVVAEEQRHLLGHEKDADGGQHAFYYGRGNEPREAAQAQEAQQHLKNAGQGNSQEKQPEIAQSHQGGCPVRGFLVRKEEKQHGTGKLIEGNLKPGDKVAIVEDVSTTGGSILKAIEAVRSFGASVKKVLVIVDRDEGAREVFEDMGYEFFSIFRIGELL